MRRRLADFHIWNCLRSAARCSPAKGRREMINGDRLLLRSIVYFGVALVLGFVAMSALGYFAEQIDIANAVHRSEQ
jgi:hypothetical protein